MIIISSFWREGNFLHFWKTDNDNKKDCILIAVLIEIIP